MATWWYAAQGQMGRYRVTDSRHADYYSYDDNGRNNNNNNNNDDDDDEPEGSTSRRDHAEQIKRHRSTLTRHPQLLLTSYNGDDDDDQDDDQDSDQDHDE